MDSGCRLEELPVRGTIEIDVERERERESRESMLSVQFDDDDDDDDDDDGDDDAIKQISHFELDIFLKFLLCQTFLFVCLERKV